MSNDWMDYGKTGIKLVVLSVLLALIYLPINFVFGLLFGATLMSVLIGMTGGLAFIIAIVLGILWLAMNVMIGGWLAQKLWKWE